MKLLDTAAFFDRTIVRDAYSGVVLFKGQLEPFDDSRRDGVGSERRILAYSPKIEMQLPTHGVVQIAGNRWIVGHAHPDEFDGEIIRQKLVIQRANMDCEIGTAASWIADLPRRQVACDSVWTKDMRQTEVTTEARAFYTLWVSATEQLSDEFFTSYLGRLHRVSNCYMGSSGLQAMEIVELPVDALRTVYITSSVDTFDKVAGENRPALPRSQTALVMSYYDQFRITAQAQSKPSHGDLQMRVLKSDGAIHSGDTVQVAAGTDPFRIKSFTEERDDTWLVHLSR